MSKSDLQGEFFKIGKFMQQKELAKELGISPASVSKLKRQGMPVDTVERASKWRRRNLEPGRIKGVRFDPNQLAQPMAKQDHLPPDPVVANQIVEVEAAGTALNLAMASGETEFADAMVFHLRYLLRAVPDDAKPRLSLRVWLRMVSWFINPLAAVCQAPDQATLLRPNEFSTRWHGWETTQELNAYALNMARDWDDYAVNGWPDIPDDDCSQPENSNLKDST